MDPQFVDRALSVADLNALRLALIQLTGDPVLTDMKTELVPIRGGASWGRAVKAEHHDDLKARAKKVLEGFSDHPDGSQDMPDSELRRLFEIFGERTMTDEEFAFHKEQFALDMYPRAAKWSRAVRPIPDNFRVGIIGAGFSGIACAVQCELLQIPYTIFERRDDLGGTWHINTFPDARVDTSSFIYQFSFEKRYPWSEYFASQPEVKKYLEHVARQHGVYEHIIFGVDVQAADFDEDRDIWRLRFGNERPEEHVDVLVACTGLFNRPSYPQIRGVAEFSGLGVHSTEWTDAIAVQGKRIAVIGNGSTGVQLMPRLAAEGADVTVFQRTPQWISPLEKYRESIPAETRWLLDTMPYYWNWFCYSFVVATFAQQDAQEIDTQWQLQGGLISERNDKLREILTKYVETQVSSRPDLIDVLTPDYPPLARRLVIDNGWYEALGCDNVALVTDPILELTSSGIRTSDGEHREFDIIVYATGFETEKFLWPMTITGRGGRTLEDEWRHDGPRAYLGISVPGFPNLFIMYGPNSQPRAGSLVSWLEVWSQHAAQAVVTMLEAGASRVEVNQDAFESFNCDLEAAHSNLIWHMGPAGRNYYINSYGRQQVASPFRIEDYRSRFHRPLDQTYNFSANAPRGA